MGDKSPIEWTDATWNPVVGCSIVSPGCTNCYAMRVAARMERLGQPAYAGLTKPSKAGPVWTGKVAGNSVKAFEAPLRWKKPRRIFVNSMSDLFHESVYDDLIDRVFAIMALCPQHTFQVLTKRPERMRRYMAAYHPAPNVADFQVRVCVAIDAMVPERTDASRAARDSVIRGPLPNVWLGVSVEDQVRADERIPLLLETPAAKRFLSCEPLVGPIDLSGIGGEWSSLDSGWDENVRGEPILDWVIVGGESGEGARPMHPDWARSLRDQCAAAGVSFFFKQWGEWGFDPRTINAKGRSFHHFDDGTIVENFGKKSAGRMLDGREWSEFPR